MSAPTSLPTLARRTLRRASRVAGRATHGARMTPGFLVVGAQRCGTTSMFKTLSQHPAVLPAVWHKGVHFFDMDYARGMAWYRGHFPLLARAARVERATGARPLTGESSPYYLSHPLAGERIARDLPDVRLIVLVRNPVDRAYSAHTHELARRFESEPFERALELEPQRLAGEWERMVADPSYASHYLQHNAYVTRGQYVDQLERLERLVGRERLHVVDSHDFFADPATEFARVEAFLGLPPAAQLGGHIAYERHNARPRSPMSAQLRARLDEHFRPYDERLSAWLGTTVSWRR